MKLPPTIWPVVLILAWICSCMNTHLVSSQCLDDQKSLLLELRSSVKFNHSTTTNLAQWNESTDCCLWSGVQCNYSTGQVISLDLSSNNLEVPVPKSIFQLNGLQNLDLSWNRFNNRLDLNEILPPLNDLNTLHLSYNCLSIEENGPMANSSFTEFLKNQSGLGYLDLSNNHIQRKVPTWIWKVGVLWIMNLSCNNLVELERPVPQVPNLYTLDLHSKYTDI